MHSVLSSTEINLGCDFSAVHVEDIRPRNPVIKRTDGTTVPIFKGSQKRPENMVFILEEQENLSSNGRPSLRVFASKAVLLQPKSLNSATASTAQAGLLQNKAYQNFYNSNQCSSSHKIAPVERKEVFNIIFAKFEAKPITLLRGQQAATGDSHPSAVFEPPTTHAELFGIETKGRHTYKKCNFSAREKTVIKKHLADSSKHMNKEEKPVTADGIELSDVNMTFQLCIRDLLGKHEDICNGGVSHINVPKTR